MLWSDVQEHSLQYISILQHLAPGATAASLPILLMTHHLCIANFLLRILTEVIACLIEQRKGTDSIFRLHCLAICFCSSWDVTVPTESADVAKSHHCFAPVVRRSCDRAPPLYLLPRPGLVMVSLSIQICSITRFHAMQRNDAVAIAAICYQ